MLLDARRLVVLREVARAGTLSAAGRALGYTQPAISHQIARLEDEVGTQVITRAGRGVRLTEAGAILLEHADTLLARIAAAQDEVAEIAGLRAGRVRLAAFPSAAATLVPHALAGLAKAHAGLEVSLVELEPPDALALLAAGDCDVAVVFDYDEPSPCGVEVARTPLLEDPLLAVLPVGHAAAGPATKLADLREETWIAGCERCRVNLVAACHGAGFDPRIAFATDDYAAVQGLVREGLGVATLPALALHTLTVAGIEHRPLQPASRRTISAVVVAGARAPAIQATIGALRNAAVRLADDARARALGLVAA